MAAVTSCVNALNNVMQVSFFWWGGGGGEGRGGGGAGEVSKGQGYNKLDYDLPE